METGGDVDPILRMVDVQRVGVTPDVCAASRQIFSLRPGRTAERVSW